MLQPDCEPLMQQVQRLTEHIRESDDRIGALEAEALQLHPLKYLVAQRAVDGLVREKHTLQDEWNTTMSNLAICRSAHPIHPYSE